MHAEVNQSVSIEGVREVVVERCVLRVGGEVAVEEQPHGIPFHAQHRLHPDPHIPHLHTPAQSPPSPRTLHWTASQLESASASLGMQTSF